MSDLDEQIGQQGVEKRTWGAEPIYPDTPPEDVLTPSEATEKIAEPRPESVPVVERDYIRRDRRARNEDGTFASLEDGTPLYEREPEKNFVSAEQAAQDLAATRQAEADYLKNQEAEQIRRATDELRAGAAPTEQQQQGESLEQWGQRVAQQQPAQPTNADAINQLSSAINQLDSAIAAESNVNLIAGWQEKRAELATALEQARYRAAFEQYPELTHSIENEINQRTQAYQLQLAQAHQQATQATQAALAATAARFPEFQGVNTIPELQLVLNAMAQSNPERFEAAKRDLSYVAAAAQNVQQLEAHRNYNQAAQFEAYAKQQDELFDEAHPELKDPAASARVSKQAVDYLKSNGLSDDDIKAVWNSPMGRSAKFQNILFDAVSYREGKSTIKEKRANPIRQVQRPGSPAERLPDRDVDLVALDRRLSGSGTPRDAAELLMALRSRARR